MRTKILDLAAMLTIGVLVLGMCGGFIYISWELLHSVYKDPIGFIIASGMFCTILLFSSLVSWSAKRVGEISRRK